MTADAEDDVVEEGEVVEPIGHVRVVYLGPVAPHWEVQSDYGPPEVIDQFRDRVLARLVLLRPTTPSSAATPSAWSRDAERENLALEWVLDYGEAGRGLIPQAPALRPSAVAPPSFGTRWSRCAPTRRDVRRCGPRCAREGRRRPTGTQSPGHDGAASLHPDCPRAATHRRPGG